MASGIGVTFSTVAAGWLAGRYGDSMAFYILTGFGALAVMLLWFAMPATRLPEIRLAEKPRTRGSDAGKASPRV